MFIKSKNQYQVFATAGGLLQKIMVREGDLVKKGDAMFIMSDEPTGNLDKTNSDIVFDIFKQLAEEFRQTLLIVTHDQGFAANTHRIIDMEDGRIRKQ